MSLTFYSNTKTLEHRCSHTLGHRNSRAQMVPYCKAQLVHRYWAPIALDSNERKPRHITGTTGPMQSFFFSFWKKFRPVGDLNAWPLRSTSGRFQSIGFTFKTTACCWRCDRFRKPLFIRSNFARDIPFRSVSFNRDTGWKRVHRILRRTRNSKSPCHGVSV